MAFVLPQMPTPVNIYTGAAPPPAAPRLTTTCQLRAAGKSSTGQDASINAWPFMWSVLLPPLTDVRDSWCPSGEDFVEVPAGSGRIYKVRYVDDVAKGFSNEYRIAFVTKVSPWPQPIP